MPPLPRDLEPRLPRERLARARAGTQDRGFVLIGVVMFILALTILGLSLFSLSGYESQFLDASYHRSQVFYDAMSGIERAKYVLSSSNDLARVDAGLPLPGLESVIYMRAMQNGDSTAAVDWSDTSKYIQIRVVAERAGQRKMIEAWYKPSANKNLYRDVIESTHKVFAYSDEDEKYNILLNFAVRHNDPDFSTWFGIVGDSTGHFGTGIFRGGGVPNPEVADFVSIWRPEVDGPPQVKLSPQHSYTFDLGGEPYRIFEGPYVQLGGTLKPAFGFSDAAPHDINLDISGGSIPNSTAVWLLPHGADIEQKVTVNGFPGTNLVIVAGVTADTTFRSLTGANLGLRFEGGIHSPGVNVFLVSDGAIAFTREHNLYSSSTLAHTTIFAAGVYLRGPIAPSSTNHPIMQLNHYPANDDAILAPLYAKGLLPNTVGRTKDFALVRGSFQEITDSNPPY